MTNTNDKFNQDHLLVSTPPEILTYQKVRKKVNYNKSLNLLKLKPHEAQQEIIDIFQEGSFDILTIMCGRRFGKSVIIGGIGATELMIPYASVLIIAPTTKNSKILFEEINKHIRTSGLKVIKRDTKAQHLVLENQAKVTVVSERNIENALGDRFSLVLCDETQSIDDIIDLHERKIQPAQADFGSTEDGFAFSKTIFIGTAREFENPIVQLYDKGQDKRFKEYKSLSYPTRANPFISRDYLAKKEKSLPKEIWLTEYEAKPTQIKGNMVYYAYEPEINVVKLSSISKNINESSQFIAGFDVGFTDNTAYVLGWVEPFTGNIYIIGEYARSQDVVDNH
ncbi:MAG TPA: hypothetical protein ENK99_01270, partial [Campylobacterales bacterium]|nr:hypothetical protein [Campylobacterales bacterium]